MSESAGFSGRAHRAFEVYIRVVQGLCMALLVVSGAGVLALTLLVTVDVILRAAGWPLTGSYDLVQILGAITIACAMPYTTAVKGHVAIEYFFLKLRRRGRIVVDTLSRIISLSLFGFLAWESVQYGLMLKRTNQVSATIQIPLFWLPWVIGFCCGVMTLVIFHNLLRPGKEMIKP